LRESEGERERVGESESEREREGPAPARLLPSLYRAYVCSYVRMLVPPFSLLFPLFRGAMDTPFYRRKEMPSCTMGSSWELTWLAGKCPKPYTGNNVAVGGAS
jgi:hypothetical protein